MTRATSLGLNMSMLVVYSLRLSTTLIARAFSREPAPWGIFTVISMDPVSYKSLIFPTEISSVRTNWAVQTGAEVTARAKPNSDAEQNRAAEVLHKRGQLQTPNTSGACQRV